MKKEDIDTQLGGMDLPAPEKIMHRQELKIPLLSYKKSSRIGLWLLMLPVIAVITVILKHEFWMSSSFLDITNHLFAAVDNNPFLTYLIPLIAIGLPFLVMTMNLLAICHFTHVRENKEILITIKIRPLNIVLLLFSFAILVYFFLPDRLSF